MVFLYQKPSTFSHTPRTSHKHTLIDTHVNVCLTKAHTDRLTLHTQQADSEGLPFKARNSQAPLAEQCLPTCPSNPRGIPWSLCLQLQDRHWGGSSGPPRSQLL